MELLRNMFFVGRYFFFGIFVEFWMFFWCRGFEYEYLSERGIVEKYVV